MEGRSDSPHEAAAQPSENIVADSQMMDTVTKFATKAPDYTFVFQVDRSLTDQDLQRLRQARLILFSLRNNNVWTLVVVLPLYKYTFHYDWAATGTDGMKSKACLLLYLSQLEDLRAAAASEWTMIYFNIKHSVNPTENSATFILDAMSRLATYLYPYEIPPTSQELRYLPPLRDLIRDTVVRAEDPKPTTSRETRHLSPSSDEEGTGPSKRRTRPRTEKTDDKGKDEGTGQEKGKGKGRETKTETETDKRIGKKLSASDEKAYALIHKAVVDSQQKYAINLALHQQWNTLRGNCLRLQVGASEESLQVCGKVWSPPYAKYALPREILSLARHATWTLTLPKPVRFHAIMTGDTIKSRSNTSTEKKTSTAREQQWKTATTNGSEEMDIEEEESHQGDSNAKKKASKLRFLSLPTKDAEVLALAEEVRDALDKLYTGLPQHARELCKVYNELKNLENKNHLRKELSFLRSTVKKGLLFLEEYNHWV